MGRPRRTPRLRFLAAGLSPPDLSVLPCAEGWIVAWPGNPRYDAGGMARDELVVEKNSVARIQGSDAIARAAASLIVGVIVLIRWPIWGIVVLLVGLVLASQAFADHQSRRLPLAVLDGEGVQRARVGFIPARVVPWSDIRSVRVARWSIRFEPDRGRAIAIGLAETANDPIEILSFAERHLPIGVVTRPVVEHASVGAQVPMAGSVVLRWRFPRGMLRTLLWIFVAAVVIAILLTALQEGEASPSTIVGMILVMSIAVAMILPLVWLGLRSTRIVIAEDGISFTGMGHLGAHRAYPWSRVRAVRRTFLPTGEPALGIVIHPDPPRDRVVLPLAWTTLAEAQLIAAMRRLAAPNTFEGP